MDTKSSNIFVFVIISVVLLILIVLLIIFKPWNIFEMSSNGDSKGSNNSDVNINEPNNNIDNNIVTGSDDIQNNVVTESDDVVNNEVQQNKPVVDNIQNNINTNINQNTNQDNIVDNNKNNDTFDNETNIENDNNSANNENTDNDDNNNTDINDDVNTGNNSNMKNESSDGNIDGDNNLTNSDIIDNANRSTFVTEVGKYMDTGKTAFISQALLNPTGSLSFTNLKNIDNGLPQSSLDMDDNKKYYIEMNRRGSFIRVLIYNSEFCYDSGMVSNLEKTDVKIEDLVNGNENDFYNGCVNKR